MMKRFSTSCCLITFFLLNSVMLYAQHENTSVQQWKIEDESRALQMIDRARWANDVVSATPDG